MENCIHGNSAPEETLDLLPKSQAGPERHKCTICCYKSGFEIGLSRAFSNEIPVFQLGCNHGKTAPEYIITLEFQNHKLGQVDINALSVHSMMD